MATYTAVLLADTAVPAWHEVYPELPFVFAAAAAMASAGGVGMIAAPVAEAGPARRMGWRAPRRAGAEPRAWSSASGWSARRTRTGRAGVLLKLAQASMAAGAAGALAAGCRVGALR